MKRALLLVGLTACSGSDVQPDALAGCLTTLAGNVSDTVSSTACGTLAAGVGSTEGDTLLHLSVKPALLDSVLDVSIDLGATPLPGVYNSGSTTLWSAMAIRNVPPSGACLYLAGNDATPTGYFTLEIAAVDAASAHGALSLTSFVLPRTADDGTQTDCGAGTTEDIQIQF